VGPPHPPGRRQAVLPSGFAAGSDGAIYVSNCSIAPAGGLGPQGLQAVIPVLTRPGIRWSPVAVIAHDHCMDGDASGVLDRAARGIGGMEVVERLAALSGSDFASVMLEVVRLRAAGETPASVLRRYRHDRFVRPGSTSWRSGRRAEDVHATDRENGTGQQGELCHTMINFV
jgi:hypothetical protein